MLARQWRRSMGWFHVAQDRLRYRGRLTPEPFAAWVKTGEGSAAIDERALEDRLRLFTRTRARRRIWRELERTARTEPLRSAIQEEAEHFSTVLAEISHAPGLPRLTVALHRLVIVPRTLVGGRTRGALRRRLCGSGPLAPMDPQVREFFCEQLLVELDSAIARHRVSGRRPVLTRDIWGCVGRDEEYQWVDPIFSGPGWGGHLLMYEFPRQGLSRSARKDLDQAIRNLQNSLTSISRTQRHEIVRLAVDGLPRLSA